MLRGPASEAVVLLFALVAKHTPGMLALACLNATANEVSSFGCQSQMFTTFSSGSFAKRTISLVHHSSKRLAAIPYLANDANRQEKLSLNCNFLSYHLTDWAMRVPV